MYSLPDQIVLSSPCATCHFFHEYLLNPLMTFHNLCRILLYINRVTHLSLAYVEFRPIAAEVRYYSPCVHRQTWFLEVKPATLVTACKIQSWTLVGSQCLFGLARLLRTFHVILPLPTAKHCPRFKNIKRVKESSCKPCLTTTLTNFLQYCMPVSGIACV